VIENRVLRKVYRPKKDEVTGEWRRLRNEELHGVYFSSNIIPAIKSRRIRWAENVARSGGEERCVKDFRRET
jgi:hypothetical protein